MFQLRRTFVPNYGITNPVPGKSARFGPSLDLWPIVVWVSMRNQPARWTVLLLISRKADAGRETETRMILHLSEISDQQKDEIISGQTALTKCPDENNIWIVNRTVKSAIELAVTECLAS
jgi:hypothetical protein